MNPCSCGGTGKLEWNGHMERPMIRGQCQSCNKATKWYRDMMDAETAWDTKSKEPILAMDSKPLLPS